MWQMIKKMRDDKHGEEDKSKLYRDGQVVDVEREGECMMEYWRDIYQKKVNEIREVWNGSRDEYINRWSEGALGRQELTQAEIERDHLPDIPRVRVGVVNRWMERGLSLRMKSGRTFQNLKMENRGVLII